MSKVILVDLATLMFRAIFNWERQVIDKQKTNDGRFILPSHYVYYTMLISALKKIGVDKENDLIIGCQEGKSWRKDYSSEYKAQRKADRDTHELINWDKMYAQFNKINDQLSEATNWHFIREWKSEADDIISAACRYYTDKEIVIISIDSDLHQLLYYSNVKFFTLTKKCKGTNGIYISNVKDPLKIISEKARKGDVSDNILVPINDTSEDADLRYFLVNLLELPKEIENAIREKFDNLEKKELRLDNLPNFKNAKEKFLQIYNPAHTISFEYCQKLMEKREEKKKKKVKIAKEEKKLEKQKEKKGE